MGSGRLSSIVVSVSSESNSTTCTPPLQKRVRRTCRRVSLLLELSLQHSRLQGSRVRRCGPTGRRGLLLLARRRARRSRCFPAREKLHMRWMINAVALTFPDMKLERDYRSQLRTKMSQRCAAVFGVPCLFGAALSVFRVVQYGIHSNVIKLFGHIVLFVIAYLCTSFSRATFPRGTRSLQCGSRNVWSRVS